MRCGAATSGLRWCVAKTIDDIEQCVVDWLEQSYCPERLSEEEMEKAGGKGRALDRGALERQRDGRRTGENPSLTSQKENPFNRSVSTPARSASTVLW